ncbi:tRNA (guanosine(37)-N1)-methyltransferase TrmD [bacterium]|nr:tRNA (guanosine(37)-N1)-methyltransferase TrmD [bacterium]
MKRFSIVTLFPEAIRAYLDASILGRAQQGLKPHGSKKGRKAVIKITYFDPKTFVKKGERVDRRPYGGGPGMVLEPEAILKAVEKARGKGKAKIIFFATDGEQFTEEMAQKLSKEKHLIFIAGRYEGVDARVQRILKAHKVSVGPYVLTGGELPAATMVDAIARFVPGVLGTYESLERKRVSSPHVYTRPEVLKWKGKRYYVPEVLLTGDHKKIEEWKKQNSVL